jgi:hypothetical protein
MRKFGVTAWPDKTNYTIEVSGSDETDLHRLDPQEASELLKCIKHVLDGGECDHEHVHHIESHQGDMYIVMMPTSDRHTKAYTVSKRKLAELKIGLMGAING